MNKLELISKIKQLDGISQDERAYLIELVNTKKKYGLVWEDKPEAVEEQLRENLPVLKEVKEKAIINGEEHPNHILIEGDNLHALTALTFTHEGKIDVIYIDPPYNTGNKDFKYNDSFVDKEDSYRHSKWLSFMNRRLRIAKKLLNQNGLIFVSIDDNEVFQLKLLCDEIFGASNFLAEFIIQSNPRGSQASKYFAIEHEYLICYSKLKDPNLEFGIKKGDESLKEYPLLDKEKKRYRLLGLRQRGGEWKREQRPNMYYSIFVNPINGEVNEFQNEIFSIEVLPKRPSGEDSRWTWGPDKFKLDKKILIGKKVNRKGEDDFWDIFRLDYLEKNDGENKKTKTKTIWDETEINYQNGGNEVKDVLGPEKFSFPKPLFLLQKIVGICSFSNNLKILDFFAGSGTTLHATMALNTEDGGNRQCILVTNNENNICEEVTYERNKRVIEGYTNSKGVAVEGLNNNNLRYYKNEFISREPSLKNKRTLTQLATELLCIKEDCYSELEIDIKEAKLFANDKVTLLILFDDHIIPQAVEFIKNSEVSEFKVYVFSIGSDPYTEDFLEVQEKVRLCALPDAIYKAYQNVLPKKNKPVPIIEDDKETPTNENGEQLSIL